MNIKNKLHLVVFTGIISLTITNLALQYHELRESLGFIKQRTHDNLARAFNDRLDDEFTNIAFNLKSLMRDPHLLEMFENREREQLKEALADYYRDLRDEFGIAQFQFHLPPATSFLRLHRLDKFGDDLSEFRRTVVTANKTQKLVKGMEVGRADLGLRVVMPLSGRAGQHLGTVEFGGSALSMVAHLKDMFGAEYAVGVDQTVFRQAKRFERGERDVNVGETVFYAFSSNLARELTQRYQFGQDEYPLNGNLYVATRIPLRDFSGREIGYVLAMSNFQHIQDDHNQALVNNIIIAVGIALLLFLIFSWVIFHTISRPLRQAQAVTTALSQGRLGLKIETQSQDEIGQLLNAIDQAVIQQFQSIIRESGMVLRLMADGRFDARITGMFLGDFADVKTATNEMASKLQSMIQCNRETLDRLAQGDLSARIEHAFPGDFQDIKGAVNGMAENLQALIQEANQVFGELAQGHTQARIHADFPGDFVALKTSANAMAEGFQGVIQDTGGALALLASGNLDEFQIAGEFPGDFAEVRKALVVSANKLAEATTRNQLENWFKTGQSRIGERTSGEQDLARLAERVIDFLCEYLEAQVGAFYVARGDEDHEDQYELKMVASHAHTWRKHDATTFQLGEGLVGQAALERKTFVIGSAPEHYLEISSGLGAANPTSIVVTPFLFNDQVKGVIELASFTPFTENHLDFLTEISASIGIAVNTAEARTRMQILLKRTKAQAEELKTRELALTQTNEELQSQTEELQSQAEELQTQQEELRQANEELELRSRDLEQQKEAIGQQNQALEKSRGELQQKAQELELISKYKSEFLANMSHELRTPLNSLLILAQLLADNKDGNLSDKQKEYARTIHQSGADLLNLINDILDLAKVEAGKLAVHFKQVALADLLRTMETRFRPLAEQKGLDFYVHVAPNCPAHIVTDDQRFTQIVTNLLSNAFKFTERGGITLTVERPPANRELPGLDSRTTLAISVTDTGIGIPADKQQVIFEAFQQADGTTNRRYGGTGLGLSISRQLSQLLGGCIEMHSEEEKGSRFTVFLPETARESTLSAAPIPVAAPVVVSPPPAPVAKPKPVAPALEDDRDRIGEKDRVILVIEDDANFAAILRDAAQEKGYRCLLADNGTVGLELAHRFKPGAIILDVGLPLVDGWTVMERLKDDPTTRHIPVHFVSGSDYAHEARRMGAIGYSMKPVSMGELAEAFKHIDRFLAKHMKKLLVITDLPDHEQAILHLVADSQIGVTVAHDQAEVDREMANGDNDCLIMDAGAGGDQGVAWLQALCNQHAMEHIPVILYADRDLTPAEEQDLVHCEGKVVWKQAHSKERLLDEITLFLHQIEAKLPEEQQQILRKIHDKEALLAGKCILLVDDDMRNVFSIGSMLEEKGVKILTAGEGEEALSLLQAHAKSIHLVLMDIMMPGIDGYETIRRIRAEAKFRKLPIIALTAKAMKNDKAKCIEAGANDYLAKPVDNAKLLSLLRVWLYQ